MQPPAKIGTQCSARPGECSADENSPQLLQLVHPILVEPFADTQRMQTISCRSNGKGKLAVTRARSKAREKFARRRGNTGRVHRLGETLWFLAPLMEICFRHGTESHPQQAVVPEI